MAVDRTGKTITPGLVYLVAAPVVKVDGDNVIIDTRRGALQVQAGDIVSVDDAGALDLRDKTLTYNTDNSLATVTYDGTDTWTMTYNPDGTPATFSNVPDGGPHTKTFGYDADGNLISVLVTPVGVLLLEDGSSLVTEGGVTVTTE